MLGPNLNKEFFTWLADLVFCPVLIIDEKQKAYMHDFNH